MNCVYDAYVDHLEYLEIVPDPLLDRGIYEILKLFAQERMYEYTHGAIVPWLFDNLRDVHGLDIKIQYRIWTSAHYIADASTIFVKDIAKKHFHGVHVDTITLAPAIYCLLTHQHAVFDVRVPKKGVPVLAIALYDNAHLGYTDYTVDL